MGAWRRLVPLPWKLCRAVSTTQMIDVERSHCFATMRWYSHQWTAPYDAGQPTSDSHPELLSGDELFPGISLREFEERRTALRSRLPTESMVIFTAASVKHMTDVVPYPFRQDADYLYYTGCSQPQGLQCLMTMPSCTCSCPTVTLNLRTEGNLGRKIAGTEEASRVFGTAAAHSMRWLPKVLPEMLGRAKAIFCDLGSLTPVVAELHAFQTALQQGRVRSLNRYSHQMRWVKSPSELKLMRKVASITCKVGIYGL